MSYTEKALRITVTLDDGGVGSQMIFTANAMSARIQKQGVPELPKASVSIWGLSHEQMTQLTFLSFNALSLRRNVIEIQAGEVGGALATVFQGEIATAAPNMNASPSPEMQIEAISAAYPKLIPQSPTSVQGEVSVDDIMKKIASDAGMSFENHGVSGSIANVYFRGGPITKAKWVARTIGADLVIDDTTMVLVPAGSTRGTEAVGIDLISPETGEIGYPTFDSMGIRASCFFNPNLRVMGLCRVSSMMPRASGVWKIYSLSHELAANIPGGGPWKTTFSATWVDS